MNNKIIAVDFDGTLAEQMEREYWPTPGAPRQAVIDYVLEQQRQGAKLILWTNRTGRALGVAVNWCEEHGIKFDALNANIPEKIAEWNNDCRKVFADEYIDDKAIPAQTLGAQGMTVTELVQKAHENAVKHGFWDNPPEFGTSVALIHSELSEALEEVRKGNPNAYMFQGKPEGCATELADAIIRIADLCGWMGIDLEAIIRAKMEYNATRPRMHGKKF